jgi:hypothetical protein
MRFGYSQQPEWTTEESIAEVGVIPSPVTLLKSNDSRTRNMF